jgi:cytoskeletal protein CcmA (bactofilin family)
LSAKRFAAALAVEYALASGSGAPNEERRGHLLAGAANRVELNRMWKRKEDEHTTPGPEQGTPVPAYNPPLSAPTRPPEATRSESLRSHEVATIGKSVVVKGELSGSEDLIIDGEIEGSISLRGQSLTVGPNGRLRANIEARNVILHGRVDGDVHATERVDLRKTASLAGNISTARISIEDGAFFKGTIDIQKAEPAGKLDTKPPASALAAAAPVPASSAQGSLLEPKKF